MGRGSHSAAGSELRENELALAAPHLPASRRRSLVAWIRAGERGRGRGQERLAFCLCPHSGPGTHLNRFTGIPPPPPVIAEDHACVRGVRPR
jgi:hypothetical protein